MKKENKNIIIACLIMLIIIEICVIGILFYIATIPIDEAFFTNDKVPINTSIHYIHDNERNRI